MVQATLDTTVTGLQGTPVSATPPVAGQILVFNGTSWVPASSVNGPLSITGALAAGSLNAGAAALTGPLTSTNDISTSGNIAVTGTGQVQMPGNVGALFNGTGYNLVSGRARTSGTGVQTTISKTATTQSMAGIGATITPRTSGVILALIQANMWVAAGSGAICSGYWYYGTGTPPAQGATPTGTNMIPGMGSPANAPQAVTSFAVVALVPGTTYWFDLSYSSSNGQTVYLSYVYWTLIEL